MSTSDTTASETETVDLPPSARGDLNVPVLETVPLPRPRARAGESFEVRVTNITAWPGQTLAFTFDYNDYMDRWLFSARHVEADRTMFNGRSVATLGHTYSAYPYLMARFVVPTADPETIRPANLGETVKLGLAPGPAGGSFVPAANLSQAEEDLLLGRVASDYPVARE